MTATKRKPRSLRRPETPIDLVSREAGLQSAETLDRHASPDTSVGPIDSETLRRCADARSNGGAKPSLKPLRSVPAATNGGAGPPASDTHYSGASTPLNGNGKGDLVAAETPHECVADPLLIANIRETHLQRRAILKTSLSLRNQCRAICRVMLGFNPQDDEKKRKGINAAAALIVEAIESNKGLDDERHAKVAAGVRPSVLHWIALADSNDKILDGIERKLCGLAKQLPVAKWIDTVKGVGIDSVAAIVGECGDLSNYANPGKLWRKLGLHVYKGKAPSTWKKEGGLFAEEWVEQGYSPARLSIAWNIGIAVRYQTSGELRELYDARKAFELTKTDKPWLADARARRYVAKRFVRNLWIAWRNTI